MNTIIIRGDAAELRYGYHLAARLGAWTVESRILTAQVRDVVNKIALTQPGLVLTVHRPNGKTLTRRLRDVRLDNGRVVAQLAPPEGTSYADGATRNDAA